MKEMQDAIDTATIVWFGISVDVRSYYNAVIDAFDDGRLDRSEAYILAQQY